MDVCVAVFHGDFCVFSTQHSTVLCFLLSFRVFCVFLQCFLHAETLSLDLYLLTDLIDQGSLLTDLIHQSKLRMSGTTPKVPHGTDRSLSFWFILRGWYRDIKGQRL